MIARLLCLPLSEPDPFPLALAYCTHLGAQDELDELLSVDPMQPAEDGEGAEHPPRVAHVLELLRSAIQASVGQLSLAEPARQLIHRARLEGDGAGAPVPCCVSFAGR